MKTNIALRCIFHISVKFLKGEFRPSMASYITHLMDRKDITIVPILVGAINKDKEELYGRVLAPYFAANDTICVVSSDFCHW
jgi:predicted class III extradiol MEMO1 family dioxygenase